MDPIAANSFLEEYESLCPDWALEYLNIHRTRFRKTLEAIPEAHSPSATALEVGTYGMFPVALSNAGGYAAADGTVWEQSPIKTFERSYDFDPNHRSVRLFDVDLERELIPVEPQSYDFVMCCEVIEHMSIDPMAMIWELNRVLKGGGKLLISTPNIACANNVERILQGEIPNSYYFYRQSRIPDRHNLEYSAPLLRLLLEAAGFAVDRLWTEQCWHPDRPDILRALEKFGFETDLRGDNLFAIGTKVAPPSERFPAFLYD